MHTYSTYAQYFEELATKHVDIRHNDPIGSKKFYQMTIEEFYSGAAGNSLPSSDSGPFVIMMDYISEINYNARATDHKDFMLMILSGFPNNDYDWANSVKDTCERICNDFINRMTEDSRNGVSLFEFSLDKPDKIRKVPGEIIFQSKYVGYQLSFNIITSFNDCVDISKWLP